MERKLVRKEKHQLYQDMKAKIDAAKLHYARYR